MKLERYDQNFMYTQKRGGKRFYCVGLNPYFAPVHLELPLNRMHGAESESEAEVVTAGVFSSMMRPYLTQGVAEFSRSLELNKVKAMLSILISWWPSEVDNAR